MKKQNPPRSFNTNHDSAAALHHILRIYLTDSHIRERVNDTISYCQRTGCSEVLIFTTSYDSAPSFAPLGAISAYVDTLKDAMQRLRAAGITISVNVLQTLGHVYFPMELQSEFPFQRRVYSDGRLSTQGACPLCPKLQDWVVGSYRQYARLQPRILFVDDDFRTVMQGLACFCELHLQHMSELAGRRVEREEVVAAICDSKWPVSGLRQIYHQATTQGLCELAAKIRAAVHEVSPETRVGLMTARLPFGAAGMDIKRILHELAGEKRLFVRPQIGMYSEGFLRDMPAAFMGPDQLRAVLPQDVEFYPEIENYHYTGYAKSAQCTFIQMASQVLMGFNHLALNVFDMFGSPFANHEMLISLLEQRRAFLDRLHQLVPEGNHPLGVSVATHPSVFLVNRAPAGSGTGSAEANNMPTKCLDNKLLAKRLPNLGLPVTYCGTSDWTLLCGDDVLAMDAGVLDELLRKGAIMDASAASALALRGHETRIGVRVGKSLDLDNLGFEEFVHPEFNPTLQGQCFPLRPLVQHGDWHLLADLTGNGIVASRILNYRSQDKGPALLMTENDKGERFGVLAFSGQGERHLIENLMRAEQLRRAFAWVARKKLPLAVLQARPYLWPILNRTKDGQLVIGITNLSTDIYDNILLVWGSREMPRRFQVLGGDGQLSDVSFEIQPDKTGETILAIPCRLTPMQLVVFVVE